MQLDKNFFKEALSGAQLNTDFSFDASFSIDTRTLQKGEIFVALQGENTDGHKFIGEALKKEASGFILSKLYAGMLFIFIPEIEHSSFGSNPIISFDFNFESWEIHSLADIMIVRSVEIFDKSSMLK